MKLISLGTQIKMKISLVIAFSISHQSEETFFKFIILFLNSNGFKFKP